MKMSKLATFAVLMMSGSAMAATFTLSSPNDVNEITVSTDNGLQYKVEHDGDEIIDFSPISITINNQELGANAKVISNKKFSKNQTLTPVIKEKRAKIQDSYNELELVMEGGYGVRFRAYDNGVAYRLFTKLGGDAIVSEEEIVYNFADNHAASFPMMNDLFSHYERPYVDKKIGELEFGEFSGMPAMVDVDGVKVAITEVDIFNYPGFYLEKGVEKNQLVSKFPFYPKTTYMPTDRDEKVANREAFIAKTKGTRDYPWRLMVLAENDAELINNTLVYQLSPAQRIQDTSWIKTGKVAWDWYNDNNLEGVDFAAGYNTATYKYYIDFAAKHGLEYINLDEGWYDIKTSDIINFKSEVDVHEVIRYAKSKGVEVILWVTWSALEKHPEAYKTFADWGAKGIKVDFMQRDDQPMMEFVEKATRLAAENKLLINLHGMAKPEGLRRAYPNLINREGVVGLENNKWEGQWSNPEYTLKAPFLRMLAGPMDYTPGAMANAQLENYRWNFKRPMSLGTRTHQLAMYVVYEAPLQMLADTPTSYEKDADIMKFLSAVPTTWDETKVLQAKYGDYVLIARKQGDTWYVGGMTDWTPRTLELDLGEFLGDGKYQMDIWQDGINANRIATDYKHVTKTVNGDDELKINLAAGGGWTAIIKKK